MDIPTQIILKYVAENLFGLPSGHTYVETFGVKSLNRTINDFKRPYFFFKDEVTSDDVTTFRHLTLYRKGFYDYLGKKEYNTMSEWAADNGKTLNDIVYGINRREKDYMDVVVHVTDYVPLAVLLKFLDSTYVENPTPTVSIDAVEVYCDSVISVIDAFRGLTVNFRNKVRASRANADASQV